MIKLECDLCGEWAAEKKIIHFDIDGVDILEVCSSCRRENH